LNDVRVTEPVADPAAANTEPSGRRVPSVAVPPIALTLDSNCVADPASIALNRGSGASSTAGASVTAFERTPRWSVATPPPTEISPRTICAPALPLGAACTTDDCVDESHAGSHLLVKWTTVSSAQGMQCVSHCNCVTYSTKPAVTSVTG
jgi:hypothetical protein